MFTGRFGQRLRAAAIAVSAAALVGCGKGGYYASEVAGKSLDDWRSEYVWGRVWAGVGLNIIPIAHFGGLVLDTMYVYSALDDIIYGVGAIKARQMGCQSLVETEDYDLFFAWQGGQASEVMGAFTDVVNRKSDLAERASRAEQRMAQRVAPLVKDKLRKKLVSKLGAKLATKVAAKAALGMVPVVGGVAAGVINYVILGDIFDDAGKYFAQKARIACRQ